MEEGRIYGTVDDISREHARLGEHGYVLMFRSLSHGDTDDDGVVEGVAARFKAENGDPGLSIWIGDDFYVARLDDLETAYEDPISAAALEEDPIEEEPFPGRDECLTHRGALSVARYAREIESEEDLFERLVARFVIGEPGFTELLVGVERFLFLSADFWSALTDPVTFRRDEEGPSPIDVLRDPNEQPVKGAR